MKTLRAQEIMNQWRGKRVAVVGDLMLDRYVRGRASRISFEAPVPVVTEQRTSVSLGGASNVLWNLAALGCETAAFGVVGDDSTGVELRDMLDAMDVDTSGLLTDLSRRTTEKTRIVAGNQQVVRVDTEDVHPLQEAIEAELLQRVESEVSAGRLDAIILEDYAKGVLSAGLVQALARLRERHGIPVALDPHPANAFRVKGLSLITPNRTEAFALAGVYHVDGGGAAEHDAALLEVVSRLQDEWAPEQLLVTLGSEGMALFDAGGGLLHIPTRAREVFDVSGAGDTVIASFVAALLGGASSEEAAAISNHAGGVVVGKIGTQPVSCEELLASFSMDDA